ncbi:unnamed protein product [Prunus armeniaca]
MYWDYESTLIISSTAIWPGHSPLQYGKAENLYLGTKTRYKLKWAQTTRILGACYADCGMDGYKCSRGLLMVQGVEVLSCLGAPKLKLIS